MMDYNLDREIRRLKESEFTNLYTWYLQEFSKDGVAVGSKFIPWAWRFVFSAAEFSYINEFKVDPFVTNDDNNSHSEWIVAAIKPNGSALLSERYPPRFSMFGTNQAIDKIGLRIQSLRSDEDPEICQAWGSPSYNFELDFRNSTSDDQIEFVVYLKPKNFAVLRGLVQHKSDDESLIFSAKGISGFYSPWSPSISTGDVKVLTSGMISQFRNPTKMLIHPDWEKCQNFL